MTTKTRADLLAAKEEIERQLNEMKMKQGDAAYAPVLFKTYTNTNAPSYTFMSGEAEYNFTDYGNVVVPAGDMIPRAEHDLKIDALEENIRCLTRDNNDLYEQIPNFWKKDESKADMIPRAEHERLIADTESLYRPLFKEIRQMCAKILGENQEDRVGQSIMTVVQDTVNALMVEANAKSWGAPGQIKISTDTAVVHMVEEYAASWVTTDSDFKPCQYTHDVGTVKYAVVVSRKADVPVMADIPPELDKLLNRPPPAKKNAPVAVPDAEPVDKPIRKKPVAYAIFVDSEAQHVTLKESSAIYWAGQKIERKIVPLYDHPSKEAMREFAQWLREDDETDAEPDAWMNVYEFNKVPYHSEDKAKSWAESHALETAVPLYRHPAPAAPAHVYTISADFAKAPDHDMVFRTPADELKCGISAVFDKWPGDETDEEIAETLAEMKSPVATANSRHGCTLASQSDFNQVCDMLFALLVETDRVDKSACLKSWRDLITLTKNAPVAVPDAEPVGYFNIVAALCRAAIPYPNVAIRNHVERLVKALEKAGEEDKAEAIQKILTPFAKEEYVPGELQESASSQPPAQPVAVASQSVVDESIEIIVALRSYVKHSVDPDCEPCRRLKALEAALAKIIPLPEPDKFWLGQMSQLPGYDCVFINAPGNDIGVGISDIPGFCAALISMGKEGAK